MFVTKDDETNPRTPSKPPTNATARQPTRSLRAEETGANINIIPRPIERTQAVKKENRHFLSIFFFKPIGNLSLRKNGHAFVFLPLA